MRTTSVRSQRSCRRPGLRIEAATFIGSSPIRRFTEGWTDDFLLQTTEKAVKYAVSLGLDVDVRHRGYEPLRSGDGEAALFDGDQLRRACHRDLRHCRARHAHGRVRAGAVCDRGSGEAFGRKDSRGLARAQRSRAGNCQFDGGAYGGRELRSWLRHRHWRARGQYADGSDAGESEADGHCAVGPSRILPS